MVKKKNQNNSRFYQLDAQTLYFNTFITFLYMFRALLCSSSGGKIVLVQPLVLSLSLDDSSVHRLRKDSAAKPLLLYQCWRLLTETAWRSRIHTLKTEL
jgi:hypothetical protein